MPLAVKPQILMLPVALEQVLGFTLLLAEFVMVGQQLVTVAVTALEAAL